MLDLWSGVSTRYQGALTSPTPRGGLGPPLLLHVNMIDENPEHLRPNWQASPYPCKNPLPHLSASASAHAGSRLCV